jgi:hypothetical protein
MTSLKSSAHGPERLYQLCHDAGIHSGLYHRSAFFISNRWLKAPDVDFRDGLDSLLDDVDAYKALRLPGTRSLGGYVSRMTRVDRSDLAFAMAELGVSKAVLLRDFPDADAGALDAIGAAYAVKFKGRPPTSRKVFKYSSGAAQANVFLDCFVRRRAYEDFEPALFCDCFMYAYGAYRYLTEGFADVLCASEAWAVIESALSGQLRLEVCSTSLQPFFRHTSYGGRPSSPFLKFRHSQPSAADRSLMHMLDRGGYVKTP